VELLVLKLEGLAVCAGAALKEFLGIDDFTVINRNIGAKKVYAPLYDAFKRHAVIGADYADQLYESDYMRTFYSGEEIQAAREKWLGMSNSGST
jgi:putative capsular polysaccharide synthesis protein